MFAMTWSTSNRNNNKNIATLDNNIVDGSKQKLEVQLNGEASRVPC